LCLVVLALCFVPKSYAADYYVSPTGTDSIGKGTLANPFKTIRYALFNIPRVATEDVNVILRGGTYTPDYSIFIDSVRGGKDGKWFAIKNYSGEQALIKGTNLYSKKFSALVAISDGAQYVRIEGLDLSEINDNPSLDSIDANGTVIKDVKFGISINNYVAHIEILNNKVHDMSWTQTPGAIPSPSDNLGGINMVGTTNQAITDVKISGNEVYNLTPGYTEAVTVNGNVDGFEISSNVVYNNKNIGICAAGNYPWVVDNLQWTVTAEYNYSRNGIIKNNICHHNISPVAISAGIYLDGSRYITVQGNTIYANSVGISLGSEVPNSSSGNHIIRSNFVYDNANAGLIIGSSTASSSVDNTLVSGNTFYKNSTIGGYLGEITIQRSNYLTFKNNILYGRNLPLIIASNSTSNLQMDYNLYYNDSTLQYFDLANAGKQWYGTFDYYKSQVQTLDQHSIFANPAFISGQLPTPNLHIASTSPAINAGDSTYSVAANDLDIDLENRVMNNRIEMGADEVAVSQGQSYYKIVNRNSQKVLTVHNGSFDPSEYTEQRTYSSSDYQKWLLVSQENNTYSIKTKHSELYLNNDNSYAEQWKANGLAEQKWVLQQISGTSYYLIVNTKDNKCLAVEGSQTTEGAAIRVQTTTSAYNQQWELITVEQYNPDNDKITNGNYKIVSKLSGKVITIPNSSTVSGAIATQNTYASTNNQIWSFSNISDNVYTAQALHSSLFLHQNYIYAAQWTPTNIDDQKWRLKKESDGYYRIINLDGNECLSVANSSEGTQVKVVSGNYTDNQKWALTSVQAQKAPMVISNVDDVNNNKQLVIYPNPVAGNQCITLLNANENTVYAIYNMLGNNVLKGKGSKIQLSGLANGLYIIQGNNNEQVKFIVK